MLFHRRKSTLKSVMVIALILSCVFPSPVFADDETPTAEATPEVVETPDGPHVEPTEIPSSGEESSSEGAGPVSDGGTDVVVSVGALENQTTEDASTNALVTALPIWCPEGVEPIPGLNGCTAEFGSISLLMDYLNTNDLGGDGTIWISEFLPPGPQAADSGGIEPDPDLSGNESNESTTASAGVDIIILDVGGNSLPLDSAEGTEALLNGQPIWCPDGITPDNGGDSCTSSVGSLGLLVSMMENGSLEEGAIYVQSTVSNGDVAESPSAPIEGLDLTNIAVEADGTSLDEAPILSEPETSSENAGGTLSMVLKDPIWCPVGTSPDPLDLACINSFVSLEDLVILFGSNQPAADGIIWIEEGNDNSTLTIEIDGNNFTTWRDFSLTLQGGWSGTPDDESVIGVTTFSQAISVTNWLGDVHVKDIVIQGSTSTGLHVLTSGNISLHNISSSLNPLDGAFLHNDVNGSTGTVTLTGINSFNDNIDDGLVIRSNSDIVVNDITANDNGDVGAYLRNDAGSGSVTLTGSNSFHDNGLDFGNFHSGLKIDSNGSISISDISATGNGDAGVYLKNNTGSGSVILTGNNSFNNNGVNPDPDDDGAFNNGLKIDSNGSISIDNITADGNLASGADIATGSGSVTLDGTNAFNGNAGMGLDVSIAGGGSIDLQNVTATGNTSYGSSLVIGAGAGSGLINIDGANVFNSNFSDGLLASTYGDIVLDNVFADGNMGSASGAKLGTACNITINSSTFSNNAAYGFDDGISSPTYPASITLNSVVFLLNGSGDYLVNNPNTVIPATMSYPCTVLAGSSGSGASSVNGIVSPGVLPLNIIDLPDAGQADPIELDCDQFSGTVLALANGDRVTYLCPTSGEVNLLRVELDGENFPGPLPDAVMFMSALDTHLTEAGVENPLTSGELTVSFVIPIDMIGFDVAMLYWDGATWLDLSSAALADGRLVFNGGLKTDDGRFEASTNFTGIFALVRK